VGMREFWDRAADENAMFFVDNSLDYRRPDADRFWREGEAQLDTLLGAVRVTLEPGDDVVEIGCGIGRLTRVLARRAATVRALDVSPRMLDLAREHGAGIENVEWLLGDGTSLAGIADASADAVVSHVVFQHIPDPEVTLGYVREIGRVLRGGGFAFFGISNAPEIHRRRPLASRVRLGLRTALGRAPRGQSDPAWLGSHIEIASLRAAAAEANADIERLEGEGTQYCLVLMRKRAARQ
jgi:SAM-dependent methyltransferase